MGLPVWLNGTFWFGNLTKVLGSSWLPPASTPVSATPFCLFLKNSHFTTLDPDTEVPKEWLKLGKDSKKDDILNGSSFLGGGFLSPKSSKGQSDLSDLDQGFLSPKSSGQINASVRASEVSQLLEPQCSLGPTTPLPRTSNRARATFSTIAGDIQTLDRLTTGRRILGKQPDPQKKAFTYHDLEWNCPVCLLKITRNTAEGLHQAKGCHLQSRHPDFNRDLVKAKKADIIVPSKDIPKTDREWSCPLCDVGLYAMPPQDMKRAINEHCRTTHPNETRKSLCDLNRRGKPNLGVTKSLVEKHEARRPVLFGSHDIVLLPQETKDAAVDRGRVSFCKKCLWKLSKIGASSNKGMTCDDVVKELTSNPWKRKMKRDWWNRLQSRDPEYAQNLLKETGWTKESLDDFLAPTYKNEAAKRAGEKRKLQLEQLKNTKKRNKSTLWQLGPGATLVPRPEKSRGRLKRLCGYLGIRIGEAQNPGPHPSVLQINTGGGPGLWRLHNDDYYGYHIVVVQECAINIPEWTSLSRLASKKGYKSYYQIGYQSVTPSQEDRFFGGVAVFVHKTVKHRFDVSLSHFHSQIVSIWIGNNRLINVYSPPGNHSVTLDALSKFWEENQVDHCDWIVLGDFNEEPSTGVIPQFFRTRQGSFVGKSDESTRWEGHKRIDFAFTSAPKNFWFSNFLEAKISDHKGIGYCSSFDGT